MRKRFLFLSLLVIFLVSGCSSLIEFPKVIWGSSTKALEEARINAYTKTFQCSYEECFAEVLKIIEQEEYVIFINDERKKFLVIMGVKGSINTTEVGLFFSPIDSRQTQFDISSLSSNAKRLVAEILFPAIAATYPEVSDD